MTRKELKPKLTPPVPPHVRMDHEMLDSPAWRALPHGAKALYWCLNRMHNSKYPNNGRLFLSERDAEQQLRSEREYIRGWFRQLEYYGFIVLIKPHQLGVEGRGRPAHWRLTEFPYNGNPATKDYLNWDGTPFTPRPKPNGHARIARATRLSVHQN